MDRKAFRELALIRLAEAQTLLDAGKFDGAYYLCGYAVERALKACICKQTRRSAFPPPRAFVDQCYTHDLGKLLVAAGLRPEFDAEIRANPDVSANWNVVKDWSEHSRYGRHEESEARALHSAVADKPHGILRWLQSRW